MLFSKLFQGKDSAAPQDRLAACREKKDWAGLARACYELGKAAMDCGQLNQAQLWLHRADTIYSADDGVYETVGNPIIDDCSDRIGALEEEDSLLYNRLPAQIDEKAREALSDPEVRIWGLLSMARLVRLGERLSALPGCQALGQLGWAVDQIFQSMQTAPTQEEYQQLMDLCGALYDLGDTPEFYAGGEIQVPGGPPFQVFDLNGMMVHLTLNSYIDNHLRLIAALSQGKEELPAAESEAVACTLLPDYYVRTGAGNPEEVPQVQAELARIWDDYDFVRTRMSWEGAAARIAAYKKLDILAL